MKTPKHCSLRNNQWQNELKTMLYQGRRKGGGRGALVTSICICRVDDPQTGRLYIPDLQESSEPHIRLPRLGSSIARRSPQSIWLWRPAGLECGSCTELEGAHKVTCTATQGTGCNHRSLGETYLWVLEDLLGRWGSAVAHCGDKDTGSRGPRECSLMGALRISGTGQKAWK